MVAWFRTTDARGRPIRRRVFLSWDPDLRELHAGGRPLGGRRPRAATLRRPSSPAGTKGA